MSLEDIGKWWGGARRREGQGTAFRCLQQTALLQAAAASVQQPDTEPPGSLKVPGRRTLPCHLLAQFFLSRSTYECPPGPFVPE